MLDGLNIPLETMSILTQSVQSLGRKKKGLSIIATLIDSIYFVQSTYCVQSTGPALSHVILTTL